MLTRNSTGDDNALRNKVNEAMSVYDEYIRVKEHGDPKDGPDGIGIENEKPKADGEDKA